MTQSDPTNPSPRPARITLDGKPDTNRNEGQQPRPSRLAATDRKVALEQLENSFGSAETGQTAILPPNQNGWSLAAWGGLLVLAFLAILVGVDAALKVQWLFSLTPWLGGAGLAVLLAGTALLVFLIAREWWLARALRRHQTARHTLDLGLQNGDTKVIAKGLQRLERKLGSRADLAHAHENFALTQQNAYSEAEEIALYEQIVLKELDQRAVQAIRAASLSSAWLTAISPFAVLDILLSLWRTLKLLREISALYGGPQSAFSSLRLLRLVFRNLFIAGGLGAGDSLLQNILGGGIAGKISAKLSEGAINGLMTARIGLAAVKILRPLPFNAVSAPTVTQLASDLANDIRTKALGA